MSIKRDAQLICRIPSDMKTTLQYIANNCDISVSDCVVWIIRTHLESKIYIHQKKPENQLAIVEKIE